MNDNIARNPWRSRGAAAALVVGGLLAGGVLASTLVATAASPTAGTTGTAAAPADQSKSQRPDEKLLTGTTASKVRAAALAKYPGATIQRVETDSDGVYEAHLVTAAGQQVTVEVSKAFAVTGNEAHGGGGPGRPNDGDADDTATSSTTGT